MDSRNPSTAADTARMQAWLAAMPDNTSVADFVPGPSIERLDLTFDIAALRDAVHRALGVSDYQGEGFHALPLTRRPGETTASANDLSGRFYLRPGDTYEEVAREEIVDESAFSEFVPEFADTYFEHVHRELTARFPIGRMRVLMKEPFTCNSWHRDPEPRLHIPIHTNPGSLFIVNHHCTHLPADGSVYFTDTRGYHTALNGGDAPRVRLSRSLAWRRASGRHASQRRMTMPFRLSDDQIAAYNADGFLIVRKLFDDEETGLLRRTMEEDPAIAEHSLIRPDQEGFGTKSAL